MIWPAWLLNAEFCIGLAKDDALQLGAELLFFAKAGSRWLDENMIAGNRDNVRIVARAFRLFHSARIRWDLLQVTPGTLLHVVRTFYIRLWNVLRSRHAVIIAPMSPETTPCIPMKSPLGGDR